MGGGPPARLPSLIIVPRSHLLSPRTTSPTLFRRLAWTAAVLAFGLIVLGGVVRITGSGLGCGEHWPLCNGQWFPPLDLPTAIEISHRWVAALVSLFVFLVGLVAWTRLPGRPDLRRPATLAVVLLVVQVLLGAVTVKLSLPPEVIIAHLGNAMLLLAVLMVAALRSGDGLPAIPRGDGHGTHRLVVAAAVLGFCVVLLGALVANYHAGPFCLGFPLCSGKLLPPPNWYAEVHWTHRLAAFTFLGLMVAVVGRLHRRDDAASLPLRRAAWLALLVTLAQICVAAAMVLSIFPPSLRALHLLAGTAVWASLVFLAYRSNRTPRPVPVDAPEGAPTGRRPSLASDLVALTKPRIISLLLVTTIAPMFITGQGVPGAGLVFWVIVGGYLMAGGANAINMWFDRDLDDRMVRTRKRPLPSGRMRPRFVLLYGMSLGAVAFAIFWHFANPLSAWLALAGLAFYVLVYTVWLKRSTPQNIVIGGAAGAFPPLVGWTAVTGHLDLAAIYLFAIIFYWTPPHFWALALLKRGEYANAGVPMMPVVRGTHHTKVQMLGYTIMLVPLTLLPWFSGTLGLVYLVAAILLGARLLWYCIKLLRENTVGPTAWKMYKFSLLYLFLLFIAMGVDRVIPSANPFRPADVMVLQKAPAPPPPAVTTEAAHP